MLIALGRRGISLPPSLSEEPQPAAGPSPVLPSPIPQCLSEALYHCPGTMGCLSVAHHCFPVKGVTLQWQARAGRPSSSEDAGLGLELILTSGSCSSRKQNQILTRKTHLPLPHCHPELRLRRHGGELACVQLLSETLLLTSESAHLIPCLTQAVLASLPKAVTSHSDRSLRVQ